MTPITATDFLNLIANPSMPADTHRVDIGGASVWFRVTRRDSAAVVISFQGTIDRDETPVPYFGTDLSDDIPNATLISISDPAMDIYSDLGSGWYAGWFGCDLQDKLSAFLDQIIAALGAERIVLQGGSAGGFAALYYGSRIPNSVVIASNPQTNLDVYEYTTKYRTACWPGLTSPLATVIDCDLVTRYATAFDNTVIYLQNITDVAHMKAQYAPFLCAINPNKYWRLIPKTTFFGKFGHRGTPQALWVPWVRAAVDAPRANATDILTLLGTW